MKKLLLLTVGGYTIFMLGCASEKSDFSKAEKKNGIETYEAFLRKYPQGEYKSEATKRIHKLAFELAKQKDSLHVYKKFQEKYPESEFSTEVSARIHELTYQLAKQKDDLQTYEEFLKEYPTSLHAEEVKEMIEYLKLPTYSDVIKTYPKHVKITYTETNIEDADETTGQLLFSGGQTEIRDGELLVFYYGAKLTIMNKMKIRGKIYQTGDKLTLDKKLNLIKVRSWE